MFRDDSIDTEATALAERMRRTIEQRRESNANQERQSRMDSISEELRLRQR